MNLEVKTSRKNYTSCFYLKLPILKDGKHLGETVKNIDLLG